MYSESDDGEDIYVEGNNVDNNNNNDGYYTTPAPPNLNGGNGGPRDRQQPPPRQRSPSASFFAQPGTLAGEEKRTDLKRKFHIIPQTYFL